MCVCVCVFLLVFFYILIYQGVHCCTTPRHPTSFLINDIITSLAKEVMFLVALVSLSVCLFVCLWTTLLKKLRADWDEILWTGPE